MSNTQNVTVSVPVFSILGIVFIVLKLTGVIFWSWWWVLAPFWIPVAIFGTFLIGLGLFALLLALLA